MRIAIVGAGLTGLSAAYDLAGRGHEVVVFERAPEVGGLARGFEMAGEPLERYYHHIFTHDTALIELAREVNVAGELEWLSSRMGTFAAGQIFPFMGPLDLLRFPLLSLAQRLRFGVATLWARSLKNYRSLEHETAESWLSRTFGKRGYQVIWEPLMRKKFEQHTSAVSAVWMWGKIALRGSSREKGKEKESLGYMRGSFQKFHEALAEACRKRGAAIRLQTAVTALEARGARWTVTAGAEEHDAFDQVLVTLPPAPMRELVEPHLSEHERALLAGVKYQGALVAVLKLDRRLTDYYWINVNDYEVPFGGVIEHTNMLPTERYGGFHVVYLSRYLSPDDPFFSASEQDVLARFEAELPKFNPAFSPEWVKEAWVFRDAYAQPVIECGYPEKRPPMATSAPGLFLANMNHIYPEDRGMNYAVRLGQHVAADMQRHAVATAVVPAAHEKTPNP